MHPPAVEEDTRQCAFSLTKLLSIWLKTVMYFLETQPMLSSCKIPHFIPPISRTLGGDQHFLY